MGGRYIDTLSSEERKKFPMATGLVDYFPDALAVVSHVSWLGNEKHNKGEPLHHARGKSMDHEDCVMRHFSTRKHVDPEHKGKDLDWALHRAAVVWRALAHLQEAMEDVYDLDIAPGAKQEEDKSTNPSDWVDAQGFRPDIPQGTCMEVQLRCGTCVRTYNPGAFSWRIQHLLGDILRYRIINETS